MYQVCIPQLPSVSAIHVSGLFDTPGTPNSLRIEESTRSPLCQHFMYNY